MSPIMPRIAFLVCGIAGSPEAVLRLIGLRLLAAVPVLLVVSLVSFGLTLLVPGDIAAELAGPSATAADLARINADFAAMTKELAGRFTADGIDLAKVTFERRGDLRRKQDLAGARAHTGAPRR